MTNSKFQKPSDDELYRIAESPAHALSARTGWPIIPALQGEDAMRQLGRDVNRALHEAGIQWAIEALETRASELATEDGQGEFVGAALLAASELRRLST